jgi:mannose-1-phosphate guanylyltransferase/mannose-6-phosphate isomerase
MIALINCGGSGSRLWPLSTPEYPKHLLRIDGSDGEGSLLQNTYNRVKDFADEVYFITEAGHSNLIIEQLEGQVSEDHIIIEPARRGTASCLLIALDHIAQRHGEDVPLVFMHADHVIHDVNAFRESVLHAAASSVEHRAITLLGVEPTFPSTGFGYIEKGDRKSADREKDVFLVSSFKEKPERKVAEKYVREGRYLWNMGYFAAPLSVFVETMKSDAPTLHENYQKLSESDNKEETYLSLADDAIDYALMEPAKNLHVVPGTFDWIDVGNFQDLHTVSVQDEEGNAKSGRMEIEGVTNSYLRNDTDVPVAVIGLDNVAVVMTKNGLVVTNRNMAHKVGDVSKRLRS